MVILIYYCMQVCACVCVFNSGVGTVAAVAALTATLSSPILIFTALTLQFL